MKQASQWIFGAAITVITLFLALYNLADYPTTWFDEGSHLHVPKALLTLGAYSDYSSDGLRTFGPTLGVGPTVLLPIAVVFKVLGIGLVQARLIIVAYLLASLYLFYRLARGLDSSATAALAVVLLASSRSIALLETGRQVLGEVPALCLVLGAFLVWFSAWDGNRWRLLLAGVLFGAAGMTKYQFLLAIAPMFAAAFVLNLVYYRLLPSRVFVWPALVTGTVFGLWQLILVVYLGPEHSLQNLAALRAATAGAATVFSLPLMKRSMTELVSFKTFGGALAIGLAYGMVLGRVRSRQGQQWGVLALFALANLAWYVFASVSWIRYAFPGLAVASLFLAKFFVDLLQQLWAAPAVRDSRDDTFARNGLALVIAGWLALIIVPSAAVSALPIVRPPANAPSAMAAYLSREIPTSTVIETWEPELGFLTDHAYHYPPTGMLNMAVRHIWSGAPAPRTQYRPFEHQPPSYVVLGPFARWVDVYPMDVLDRDYRRLTAIGGYELYARRSADSTDGGAAR